MAEFFYHILTLNICLTPLIAALLILMPLFRKRYSANWRYWVWLVISLRLLVPFSFGEYSPFLLDFPSFARGNTLLPEALSQSTLLQNNNLGETAAVTTLFTSLTFENILMIIYFSGVIAFLVYKFVLYTIFCMNIRRWSKESLDVRIAETVSEVSKSYGLNLENNGLKIRICNKTSGPMAIGLLRQTLLLPDNDYDNMKLKFILRHEMLHIKRRDLWYKLALLFVCALHWFNPVVHIMAKRADRDLEISCDNMVLKSADINEKKLYSMMIIEMAANSIKSNPPVLSTNFKSGKDSLENRIKGIFDSGFKKSGTGALIIVLVFLLILGELVQISNNPLSLKEINHPAGQEIRTQLNPDNHINEERVNYDKEVGGNNSAANEIQAAPATENNGSLDNHPQDSGSKTASPNVALTQSSQPTAELVIIDLNQLSLNAN